MPNGADCHRAPRQYAPELRASAVRLVWEIMEQTGESSGVVTRVAGSLGIGVGALRRWVRQAEIDQGSQPGLTTELRRRIAELERDNRRLRRANEALKGTAALLGEEICRRSDR